MNRKIYLIRVLSILLLLTVFLSACSGGVGEPSLDQATDETSTAVSDGLDRQEYEASPDVEPAPVSVENSTPPATLLYQGHASLRITTGDGKVIYIDPWAGEGYEAPADLILVTHDHMDHNQIDLIETRNPDCLLITQDEALAGGNHQVFELDFVTVEAGYNDLHDVRECVGYILTFSNGASVYVTGDTSTTQQMPLLAERELDYAFYCSDGLFNMNLEEAARCAALVQAKHSIPYHMAIGVLFDREIAEQFQVENRLIVADSEELLLVK